MTEWCMAHPWMTLLIVLTALLVVDDIVGEIRRMVALRVLGRLGAAEEITEVLNE